MIGFQIVRSWGASALDVAKDARAVVERLQTEYPHVKFAEASSQVGYIQESFDASMEMLIEGALLAILVVWLFLRDWRATLVSAVALPLSIIPTFWAIWVLGYTLNILTLLALSLVVGILVDDAIVEVENIVRHLRMGKKPKEAAMDAAIEIGLAVVATTFTICAVFVPVAFMSGIAGEFFGPFSFTVVVAVLCSLLVARTLTPMMAAYFLKPHDRPERPSRIMTWYLERVRWCLAHRWWTLGVAAAAISAMLGLFPLLSTAFSPAGDNGFTTLSVELAPGASLKDTLEVAETARRRLDALPEVGSVYTTVGTRRRWRRPDGRRLRGQRAARLDGHPARQSRRHARRAAALRAQGDRDPARHSRRAVPVRRRWRRQPALGHARRRRAEPLGRSRPPTPSARFARCRGSA